MPFFNIMTLIELETKLKTVFTYDKAMQAIFKYLKNEDDIILQLNKSQLFEQSIGADGRSLGFYSLSDRNEELGIAGQPYDMVDTGLFKSGIRIDFYYRHISIRSEYHTYEMIESGNFLTTAFFGLTEESYTILLEHVKSFMTRWMFENL